MLGAPLRRVTAVTHESDDAMAGRWHGVAGVLDPPRHQPMHMPIAHLHQAAEPPRRDGRQGPASEFFQGFPPWVQSLHEDESTQDEAMAAFPDAGHPAQQDGNKKGQGGDRDHNMTYHTKGGGDHTSGIAAVLF